MDKNKIEDFEREREREREINGGFGFYIGLR
jgi:hypothetical protein